MTTISPELRERIQDVLDGDNILGLPWLQFSPGECDAIARNLLRYHAENEITDELIESEVEIFYNA